MINVCNLTKRFDKVLALDDLSINVTTGSIYGLVGMNGAGKTTLLKHITGILKADSGEIFIDGKPTYENISLKQKTAFIPDNLSYYKSYKLKDAARFFNSVYVDWDDQLFNEIIDKFNLDSDMKISHMSKGMQKQAVFSLVLATQPDHLILDEPIDGLDPIARKLMWKFILDATARREMTVLVSSHNLKEMEGICDHIGILSHGKLLMERDLDELKSDIHKVQASFKNQIEPNKRYQNLDILHIESRGAVDLLIVKNSNEELDLFVDQNDPVVFDYLPLSLEEIFIYELGGGNSEIESIIF